MSSFFFYAFTVILLIVWVVSGGFISQAHTKIHSYRKLDDHLARASSQSFWASFITWFLVVGFVVLIVVLLCTGVLEIGLGAEALAVSAEDVASVSLESLASIEKQITGVQTRLKKSRPSLFATAFLIGSMILVGITGGLSASTAANIKASPNYDPTNPKMKKAYNDAIIAASLSLGSIGLLVIGLITYYVVLHNQRKALEREQAELQQALANKRASRTIHPPPKATTTPKPATLKPITTPKPTTKPATTKTTTTTTTKK